MSDITDYYTTLNLQRSRAIAGKHVTVLAGLEAIGRGTSTDARILWMRPGYVALLGRRARPGLVLHVGFEAPRPGGAHAAHRLPGRGVPAQDGSQRRERRSVG